MALEETLLAIIILIIIIIISSLPLYLAVKMLGGKVSILRAFLVMLVTGILSFLVNLVVPIFGTLIAWLLLIWVFHEVFRLKWLKAVLAWLLWIAFILLFMVFFAMIGISTLFLSFL